MSDTLINVSIHRPVVDHVSRGHLEKLVISFGKDVYADVFVTDDDWDAIVAKVDEFRASERARKNDTCTRCNQSWTSHGGDGSKCPTNTDDPVMAHIERIADEAGYAVMGTAGILGILHDRETISDVRILALTADNVNDLYESYIGPAVNDVEDALSE